jgi:UDP-glucose 4-epimerase
VNVLITGGCGFIGSHLADQLLARGDRVTVVDNFATGRRDNLDPSTPGLTIVEGSIAESELVEETFAKASPDVLVHAAASYKDPDNWTEDARTNALGSAIVSTASKRHGVNRLIYFQTALCYGLHPKEQPITIEHPLDPGASSYAISKTAGEGYCFLSGVETLSFRLANAYGPRNLSGPLPTFFHRIDAGKPCFVMDTRRDFVYISDLIEIVIKAIDGKGAPGRYHISSGGDYAIKELYDATIAAIGRPEYADVEIRPRGPDDAFTILLDPSLTERTFDWKAHTPLSKGVADAIHYYRECGIQETFTHLHSARIEAS